MQVLFLWDVQGNTDGDTAGQVIESGSDDPAVRQRALRNAQAAWEMRPQADEMMQHLAPQWPPRRQPGVDRAILRLAIWELSSSDTPPKVVIDEAIELAKSFSTEQSPAFINGVLDAVLKHKNNVTSGLPPA